MGWGTAGLGPLPGVSLLGTPPCRPPPPLPGPRTTPRSGCATSGAAAATNAHPEAATWPPCCGAAAALFWWSPSPLCSIPPPQLLPRNLRARSWHCDRRGSVSAHPNWWFHGRLGSLLSPQAASAQAAVHRGSLQRVRAHARWCAVDTGRARGVVATQATRARKGRGCQGRRQATESAHARRLAPSTRAFPRRVPLATQCAQRRGPEESTC